MKVIAVAYGISPYKGSEMAVAWNWVINMSKVLDSIDFIYCRGQEDIQHYLEHNSLENVRFHCCTDYQDKTDYFESQSFPLNIFRELYYNKWFEAILPLCKKIITDNSIDLLHYIGPIGFKEPGSFYKLDIPYVWGPMTGVHDWPIKLLPSLSFNGIKEMMIRRVALNTIFWFSRRVKKAFNSAKILLAATPETQKQIYAKVGRHVDLLPENALDKIERVTPISLSESQQLNIFFNGAGYPRKGLKILLDSLSIKENNLIVHVFGEGPEVLDEKKYAHQIGVEQKIIWHGILPRKEVQEIMNSCHINVITSASEGNPTIIWECMAKSIPTLSLNHCGMSNVVDLDSGFLVDIASYNQIITAIADIFESIRINPNLIHEKSKGVVKRRQFFLWEYRVNVLLAYYKEAIS